MKKNIQKSSSGALCPGGHGTLFLSSSRCMHSVLSTLQGLLVEAKDKQKMSEADVEKHLHV